jgi:endoplasmic reticulum chaperone BiP
LSADEIERMVKDAEKFQEGDKRVREQVEAKNELESYVYSLKSQVNDKEKLGDKLSGDEKQTIQEAVEEKIKWLEVNANAVKDELKEQKKSLEDIVNPIITKIYKNNDNKEPSGGSDSGNDNEEL